MRKMAVVGVLALMLTGCGVTPVHELSLAQKYESCLAALDEADEMAGLFAEFAQVSGEAIDAVGTGSAAGMQAALDDITDIRTRLGENEYDARAAECR